MAEKEPNSTNFVKDTQGDISQVWRAGTGWVNPTPSPASQHIFSTGDHHKISV